MDSTKKNPNLAKPTIHLNGDSAENLYEGFLNAYHAMTAAITTLENMHPNGRNFYPQGDDALTLAVQQNLDRIRTAQTIRDDVLALAEHCRDVIEEKAKRRREYEQAHV